MLCRLRCGRSDLHSCTGARRRRAAAKRRWTGRKDAKSAKGLERSGWAPADLRPAQVSRPLSRGVRTAGRAWRICRVRSANRSTRRSFSATGSRARRRRRVALPSRISRRVFTSEIDAGRRSSVRGGGVSAKWPRSGRGRGLPLPRTAAAGPCPWLSLPRAQWPRDVRP